MYQEAKENYFEKVDKDNVTIMFLRQWLSIPVPEREYVTIMLHTQEAKAKALEIIESRPQELLEAKVYDNAIKITKRSCTEFALLSILYADSYLNKY